jgi:hypothetical protein
VRRTDGLVKLFPTSTTWLACSGLYPTKELEGKRRLGRPRLKWKVNIEMALLQVGCGGVGWAYQAQYSGQWRH